jgi:hypothetical protein
MPFNLNKHKEVSYIQKMHCMQLSLLPTEYHSFQELPTKWQLDWRCWEAIFHQFSLCFLLCEWRIFACQLSSYWLSTVAQNNSIRVRSFCLKCVLVYEMIVRSFLLSQLSAQNWSGSRRMEMNFLKLVTWNISERCWNDKHFRWILCVLPSLWETVRKITWCTKWFLLFTLPSM